MDILCSRRSNITRLQTGLGLPVRDLFGPAQRPADREIRAEFRTSLPFIGSDNVEQKIAYRELRQLGAFDEQDRLGRAENFHWLWRSTINQYDIHSRIWQRWLVHLFKQWRTWPVPRAPRSRGRVEIAPEQKNEPWWDGFTEYDHYLAVELTSRGLPLCYVKTDDNPRWDAFCSCCDALIEALERASPGTGGTSPYP
jgi:hypothetical protein